MVALHAFQAALLELRSAGLSTVDTQKLHRIYVNGAVTHLLRGSLLAEDWCDEWDHHVEQFWEKLLHTELTATQRVQLHLPAASELGGRAIESARWRREAAFLGSWHLCLSPVAAAALSACAVSSRRQQPRAREVGSPGSRAMEHQSIDAPRPYSRLASCSSC